MSEHDHDTPQPVTEAEKLCNDFTKKLRALGVGDYMVVVNDPDADFCIHQEDGSLNWRFGVCSQGVQMIREKWKDAHDEFKEGQE